MKEIIFHYFSTSNYTITQYELKKKDDHFNMKMQFLVKENDSYSLQIINSEICVQWKGL